MNLVPDIFQSQEGNNSVVDIFCRLYLVICVFLISFCCLCLSSFFNMIMTLFLIKLVSLTAASTICCNSAVDLEEKHYVELCLDF